MTQLVNGTFEDIPNDTGLSHKGKEIDSLLSLIE